MPENGLPRREILSHVQDIKKVFANGIVIRAGSFKLYALRGPSRKFAVILKKTCKGAVRRNRIKRWVRDIYRLKKNKFPENAWILIFFSTDSSALSCKHLREEVENILPALQQKWNA